MTDRDVAVTVGTVKGLFVLRSGANGGMKVEGPFLKGWKATAVTKTTGGDYLLASASAVYAPSIHRSSDLTEWKPLDANPAYTGRWSERELA